MPEPDWNARYANRDTPWDVGTPDEHLRSLIESGRVAAGAKVLEIGCGTGTNARWMAEQGYDVLACDLSTLAVERARKGLEGRDDLAGRCRFEVRDFLTDPIPGKPFDFAFDRGVFHVFDDPGPRHRFAARVAEMLSPGGLWASLIGSTEGPPRDHGPPRRSLRQIAEAVEPSLEIVELHRMTFHANTPTSAAGWWLVARARTVPAQPPSRHDAPAEGT